MIWRWFHHGDVISGQVDLHMTILLDNLLIYGQPNTKTLWTYLQTLMRIPGLVSVFADY